MPGVGAEDAQIVRGVSNVQKFRRLYRLVNVDDGKLPELLREKKEAAAATLAAVTAAGRAITAPTFAFPGGRRFHFRDADGHKLAAMQAG